MSSNQEPATQAANTPAGETAPASTTSPSKEDKAAGKRPPPPVKSLSVDDAAQQRRSSSRSIKRKKFDDELVESSISYNTKNTRSRTLSSSAAPTTPTAATASTPATGKTPVAPAPSGPSASAPTTPAPPPLTPAPSVATTSSAAASSSSSSAAATPQPEPTPPPPVSEPRRPRKRSEPQTVTTPSAAVTSAKRRRHRNAHNNAIKDLGRWKPQDDLLLVLNVQQTNDLETVYRGVKFSCRFTLREIEDRWYSLLYDPIIAKIGVAAMRQLHAETIALVHREVLFSEAEESILKTLPSSPQPSLDTLEELLHKHAEVFLRYRTPKDLHKHWGQLKHFHLLNDQTLLPLPKNDDIMNFSDAEEMIESETYKAYQSGQLTKQAAPGASSSFNGGDVLSQELMLADRKAKREIRHLENEIPKWQVLVDSITGIAPSDFDNQTLAVLRGRLVRYLMRSKEITLGRITKQSTVDVDLALEGPASKISRKQGLIKLQPNGDFMLANTGKRPFYVDSKPVLKDNFAKLNNNSVIEVAGLRFIFVINQDLISAVRTEALKNQM